MSFEPCAPKIFSKLSNLVCTSTFEIVPCWIDVDLNTLRPRQNERSFADGIFKCILLNENAWISFKISLKFVPKVRIYKIPALVQIMTWRRPGDKPLSEPMMVNLLTHICVTRPQWVNYITVVGYAEKWGMTFRQRYRNIIKIDVKPPKRALNSAQLTQWMLRA